MMPDVRSGVVDRPGLFARLGGPAQVTVVSAPPGSGKTVLLRSWIGGTGLAGRLLKDLAPLGDRLWLVIDDPHELGSYPGPAFTPRATPAVPAWSSTKTTAACSTSPSSAPVRNVNAKNKPSRFASTARVKILSMANLSSVSLV